MAFKSAVKNALLFGSSVIHRNHKSKVLFYHDVYKSVNYKALDDDLYMGTPLNLFQEHVAVIRKEGYRIVPHISSPDGEVVIMFDDGFRGIWECREFFYEQQICPTICLPVDYIGRKEEGILTIEEIRELQQHGFLFTCHGWSHEDLTQFADEDLKRELGESKAELERLLGKSVDGLCLPLGLFSDHLLDEIRKYGYEAIYSCIPGNYDYLPHGILRTRNLCQFASPLEVRLILRGGNEVLKGRYERMHHKSQEVG